MDRSYILLVEDEDNIALALEILLKRAGYEVHRIKTGAQALPNIRARRPALVLLDVTLPEASGYDICQQLHMDEDFSGIPVLLMTARATPVERRKALALGADAVLTKPFEIEDLLAEVTRLAPLHAPQATLQDQEAVRGN
ncbi:Transcriptional regulatory protein YycF [Aquimixticola soesokkakensis]|uniref:Transcriptional regulatory protein YycF n=1 Tax=Aquimixticola soesokkakensis TaxID=1519096 RepID=A0A1Y5RKC9_9RHOB|nr:response regulator [Aquimixticola soesokkakensis]SLN19557.1 Transcriptional regulatory protein YycF [Aquimixticola soesokkakensis]